MVRVLLVLLALASPVFANVGKHWEEGAHIAEPGGLKEIAIAHEALRFDLRGIADDPFAKVAATYDLDHRGAQPITAQLVFVAGANVADMDITLDGVRQTGVGRIDKQQVAALPASWRAQMTTPALGGGEALGYDTEEIGAFAFALTVTPGKHQLAVTYKAFAQWSKTRSSPTILHQLGYMLAPARDWAAFGTLDIVVEVPPGWEAATSPRLLRTDDTLRGQFPSLPADTFGITVRAPPGTLHRVLQILLPLLALVVFIGGIFVLRAIGRARGRQVENLGALWPVSLPVSLVWGIGIAVSGGLWAASGHLALPAGESGAYGYGPALGIVLAVFIGAVAIPAGVLVARAANRMK
jgi:hypothetical protein